MLAMGKAAPFAALSIAAGYLYWLTLSFEFPRAPGRLGPDIWPQIVLVLLVVACIVGIANAFREREEVQGEEHGSRAQAPAILPSDAAAEEDEVPSRYGLVVLGLALFLIYPLALEYLGFLAATFLLMALFMVIGQWRNPVGVLATSLLGTLALFYVFRGIVYVSLPLGTGPFHDFTIWVSQLVGMR